MGRNYQALTAVCLAIVATAPMSGCAADGTIDMNRAIGTGLGAAVGLAACQLTGANDTECAAAILAGAAAGYIIADRIKPADKPQRDQTVATVLTAEDTSVGETTTYTVADTGSTGSVTLLGISTNNDGWECKQLEEDYDPTDADAITETYTMCRNPETDEWVNA